jgi:ABC-type lipoprotein export system ATPase subunit
VLVSHDATVAARADRIVAMLDGRIDPAAFASDARAAAARRA